MRANRAQSAFLCSSFQVLVSCAAEGACDAEILNNMRRAVLSYAVFDKRAKTCPNHKNKQLKKSLRGKRVTKRANLSPAPHGQRMRSTADVRLGWTVGV